MRTVVPSKLLRAALIADAIASGALALLQIAAAAPLAEWLQLPHDLVAESGAFLVAYTALLIVLAASGRVWPALIVLIVAGNVGWAIGCAALPAGGFVAPNALGVAYLAVQAVAVLVFAALQYFGLKSSSAAPGETSTSAA
jgi:hypothetical protein